MCSILRWHLISMAFILLWSSAVRVHDSQAYRKMDVTRERISRILELREILSSIQTGFSLVNTAVVCSICTCPFRVLVPEVSLLQESTSGTNTILVNTGHSTRTWPLWGQYLFLYKTQSNIKIRLVWHLLHKASHNLIQWKHAHATSCRTLTVHHPTTAAGLLTDAYLSTAYWFLQSDQGLDKAQKTRKKVSGYRAPNIRIGK